MLFATALAVPLAAPLTADAQQVCGLGGRGASSPTARFVDHGDGTVTDSTSQLMWMRCSAGQQWRVDRCEGTSRPHTWDEALGHAGDVNRSGSHFFNDWRLPTLPELASIAERECRHPRVNASVFPNTATADYWSATPRPGRGGNELVLVLSFDVEGIGYAPRDSRNHLRLVRTGP